MARRRKDSSFDDLLEIATMLPWQVDLVIAVLAYAGFHYASMQVIQPGTDIKSITDNIPKQFFVAISHYLQYLFPFVFVLGACISAYKARHRAKLLEAQSGLNSLRAMSWQDFELLVGEAFRRQGYLVEERGGAGPDGGVDLVLRDANSKTVVQCKRWRNASVNVSLVRELYGVMTAEHADKCIFVSSGTYTPDAIRFAKGKPIWLIDGQELLELVAQVQTPDQAMYRERVQEFSIPPSLPDESCPLCGASMIKRVAKKGQNAGNTFWGCSKFPACRGTR